MAQSLPNLLNNLCCFEKPLSNSEFDAITRGGYTDIDANKTIGISSCKSI